MSYTHLPAQVTQNLPSQQPGAPAHGSLPRTPANSRNVTAWPAGRLAGVRFTRAVLPAERQVNAPAHCGLGRALHVCLRDTVAAVHSASPCPPPHAPAQHNPPAHPALHQCPSQRSGATTAVPRTHQRMSIPDGRGTAPHHSRLGRRSAGRAAPCAAASPQLLGGRSAGRPAPRAASLTGTSCGGPCAAGPAPRSAGSSKADACTRIAAAYAAWRRCRPANSRLHEGWALLA